MTAKIANGDGFIAALDQSGGSTPKALGYGWKTMNGPLTLRCSKLYTTCVAVS